MLLEGDDGYRISDLEDREIYEAVENLYVLDRTQRRLFTLANLLPRALAGRLHKWIGEGRYASLFDNIDDTLTVERLQVFDFEAMRAYPAPRAAAVLRPASRRRSHPGSRGGLGAQGVRDGRGVALHPASDAARAVQEGLKTWRKRNAAMILATQTVEDFASADLLRTIVESCPTKLAGQSSARSPALRRAVSVERDGTRSADGPDPRQQILLKRPDLAKVLTLAVDPRELLDLHQHSHRQRTGRRDVSRVGFEAGLDRLVASA